MSDTIQQVNPNSCDDCNTYHDMNARTQPLTWSESMPEIIRGNMEARKMFPLSYMELILTSDCNLRCS